MALKKKKGSSMITVIIIFAILTIIGLSTLSLVASDYQMRIVSGKKNQSLYGSDSGINAVSAALQKVTEQARIQGNKDAEDYLKNNIGLYTSPEDGSVDKAALDAAVASCFKDSYELSILTYLNSQKENLEKGIYKDENDNYIELYKPPVEAKWEIKLNYIDGTAFKTLANGKRIINIQVTSSYYTEQLTGETQNSKEVKALITLSSTDYKKDYALSYSVENKYINAIWKNAIAIDGNMNLKSSVNFVGDVFVKGNAGVIDKTYKTYTKYNGGIIVGDSDPLSSNSTDIENNKVTFKGSVITYNSFNINGQNRKVKIDGDLYAGNVYVGKVTKDAIASNNTLIVEPGSGTGAVYTKNDLALNATTSKISIDKYYGINDITAPLTDEEINSSSSIIINTDDIGTGSEVSIASEAIIMGSAYVDTNPSFQTGESVAIKGNYKAYTQHIEESKITDESNKKYKESNVKFDPFKPFFFAQSFIDTAKDMLILNKAEYIKLIDSLPEYGALNKSGVNLPTDATKTYNSGAVISENKLIGSKTTVDEGTIKRVQGLQESFAEKVYELNGIKPYGNSNVLNIYSLGNINKTVFDGDPYAIPDDKNIQINKVKQVVLNSGTQIDRLKGNTCEFISDSQDVIIVGKNPGTYTNPTGAKIIVTDSNGNLNGIIITQKNVKAYGEINYNGTILAGGNFTVEDNKKKTFSSNNDITSQLITNNYNLYKNIFNNLYASEPLAITMQTKANSSGETGEVIQSGLVRVSNWEVNNKQVR